MNFRELGIAICENGRIEQRVDCRCGPGKTMGVNIETGIYHCFRCGWSGRAGTAEVRSAPRIERLDDPAVAERKRERLRRIWSATVGLDDPAARAVRQYLHVRGLGQILADPPRLLRAHVGLPYFDGTHEVGIYPAMVALLMNAAGEGVTLHATYVRADGSGKAPVPAPKKILGVPTRGATKGGAIRLYPPKDGILGVAEGIESALSLHLIQRISTWSAFCADNLAGIRLPRLQELYIGVDVDENGKGESAARKLAQRINSWSHPPRVMLVIPDGEQVPRDLNNELCTRRTGRWPS